VNDVTPAMAVAIVEGGGDHRRPPLVLLYDARCVLCRRLKTWLAQQATLVPVVFVAAGSPAAQRRFPDLDHERTTTVLTVVAADGAVYEGERAWLVCAWSLPRWRVAAEHFGTRARLPLVRTAARAVDWYRHRLIARSYGEDCGDRCDVTAPAPAWPPPESGARRG
jgi:predicted DCC family thiol-disulfide oxidoreductase YuxK